MWRFTVFIWIMCLFSLLAGPKQTNKHWINGETQWAFILDVCACSVFQVKCDHYWPFTDEPVMYGEISVEMLSESESTEWTIRKFRLGYVCIFPGVPAGPLSTTRGDSNTLLWSLSFPCRRIRVRTFSTWTTLHGQIMVCPQWTPLRASFSSSTSFASRPSGPETPLWSTAGQAWTRHSDSGTVLSYKLDWRLASQNSYCLFHYLISLDHFLVWPGAYLSGWVQTLAY